MLNRKEFKWVIGFSFLVMILTTLPYLLGYFSQGENWKFSGFIFGVEDGNSYIAKMLSGAIGAFLFRTPYTAMDQNGFLAFFPYILLGKLTSSPGQHEQLVVLFQLFRCAGILFLSLTSYLFISLFIEKIFFRRMALVLSILGGGLGWLSLFWNVLPLEMYSPETYGFLSVLGLPHLLFSRGLLLLGLFGFLKWERNLKSSGLIGILFLLIGFFQPLTIVIGWAVLCAYFGVGIIATLIKKNWPGLEFWKKELINIAVVVLISSPWVIYNLLSFQFDPYLRGWYSQNIILSPSPVDYLVSMGLLIIVAVWGLRKLWVVSEKKGFFASGWLIIFPVLVYAPVLVQRRMAEGFWVLLVVLILIPFFEIKINPKILMIITVPLFLCSLILLAGGISAALIPQKPVFIPKSEYDASAFLRKTVANWEVVLAPYDISNVLPAWSPVRVVAGHGPESVNLKQIELETQEFFQNNNQFDQTGFLNQYHIKYILVESNNNLLWKNSLFKEIYGNNDFLIFEYSGQEK